MLECLKKVNNLIPILILALLINISILYASPNEFENKIIFREISDYIINNEWDFESESFFKESYDMEQIFKKHKVEFEDYYIIVMKLQNIEYDIFVIKVFVISKGVINLWIGKWVLIEGENISEEIVKKEREDVRSL